MADENPTNPTPKFVAPEFQRSRIVRSFLAEALKFLKREVPIQAETGDLSTWVLSLHGLSRDEKVPGRYRRQQLDEKAFDALGSWFGKTFGPYLDPKTVNRARAESDKFKDEMVRSLAQNPRSDVKEALNALLSEEAPRLMDLWGMPRELLSAYEVSVDTVRQMLRAFRTVAVCLQVHKTHALTLILRASKGQRQAVLDLVKVDRMFLHDPCTEAVIKKAELLNDHSFLDQLARAQEYKFKLKVRSLHHLYFHVLFLMEQNGPPLPTLHELSRVLDPHGREYESLESFERDFQRRREDFQQMVADAYAELRSTEGSSKPQSE